MFEAKDGAFRAWGADVGFLQLWVLQDFYLKCQESESTFCGPHFLHGPQGVAST